MSTPIIPGAYGQRTGSGGSPTGGLGSLLIAVLGRGDKNIAIPSGVTGTSVAQIKTGTGFTTTVTVYYKITAYNDNGETIASSEVSVAHTGTVPAPKSSYLKWNLVRGAKGYKVYRSPTTGTFGATSLVVNIVGAASAFEDPNTTLTAGTPPTTGGALWVGYNNPTLYFSMSQIREYHGASSDLGLASVVAERMNVSRLMVVSVDFTAVDAAVGDPAKLAAKVLAYRTSLATLQSKQVDIVVCLESNPEIAIEAKAHCATMYGNDPKMWRKAFSASAVNDTIGDGVTVGTITKNCISLAYEHLLMTAPNTPYLSYYNDYGQAVTTELQDGSLVAFAAACLKATVGDEAEQMTQKVMAVFDKFGTDFNPSQIEYLLTYGCCPFIQDAPGQQRCVKGISTDTSSIEASEISIGFADFRVGRDVTSAAAPFIGKKIVQELLDAMKDKVSMALLKITGSIITSMSGLEVFQDETNPTWVIVRFSYKPMYCANVVNFNWSYDLKSGQALRAS